MGNTIRDISGAKFLEMQVGRIARKPVATVFGGGTWSKIRVALYVDFFYIGGNVGGSPVCQIGLCSGTTNIPGDTTPTNAVGLNITDANWVYASGGSANTYIYNCGTCFAFKNVGGVSTNGLSSTPLVVATSNNENGLSSGVFVDITKGSPNYTIQAWCATTTAATITEATYETASIAGVPTTGFYGFLTARTIAFDESAGTLDSVFVYHNQAAAYARVKQLRVVRLA